MTEQQSIEETKAMADLFPTANETQLDFWRLVFLRHDQAAIRRAILRHREVADDFIDKTQLMAEIQNASYGTPGDAVEARRGKAMAEFDDREKRRTGEREPVRASFESVSQTLHRFTDAELLELKAWVLEKNPSCASFLEKSDVKKSPVLRSMMAIAARQLQVSR